MTDTTAPTPSSTHEGTFEGTFEETSDEFLARNTEILNVLKTEYDISPDEFLTYDFTTDDVYLGVIRKILDNSEKMRKKMRCYQKFYTPNVWVPRNAAKKGDLQLLKEANENGCPFDYWTVGLAAEKGHIDCIKYMIDIGVKLEPEIYDQAIMGNQLGAVKYLVEQGCKFKERTIESALTHQRYDILVYLVEKGCPLPEMISIWVNTEEGFKCLEYLIKIGKINSNQNPKLYMDWSDVAYHERIRSLFNN